MKINGIDIKKYDAKQLTADVQPPSFSNSYEWLTSAALPTEFETEIQMSSKRLKRESNSTNTQQSSMSRSWRERRSRMVLNHRSRQSRHVLSLRLRVRDGMSEHVPSQRKEQSTSRRASPHGMSCKSASRHIVVSASSIH